MTAPTTSKAASPGESLLRRALRTPVRTLLRGRLTSLATADMVLADADLPERLRDLVHHVVRRTRLWNTEKIAVAQELVAHFQDGLSAGTPSEDLLESFGNLQRAARLIRRSKQRNRPALWVAAHRMKQGLGLLVLLLMATYLVLLVRINLGSPTLARNYWTELNAPVLATPEQERAWPLYRKAAAALSGDRHILHRATGPNDEEWNKVVAFVEANQQATHLFRRAAKRPTLGYLLRPVQVDDEFDDADDATLWNHLAASQQNPPLMGAELEHCHILRHGAILLAYDAHLAADADDSQRFCDDIQSIFGMANHAVESPFLVSDLVSIALVSQGLISLGHGLHHKPETFSHDQLVMLAHALSDVRGGGPFRANFHGERSGFLDLVQRLYTDDGHGGGVPLPSYLSILASVASTTGGENGMPPIAQRLLLPALSPVIADRRELLREYHHVMDLAEQYDKLPLWERESDIAGGAIIALDSSSIIDRLRYQLILTMVPSLSQASFLMEAATQERDAMLAALALEVYRREHNQWPAALDALVPRFLPSVPHDRYDGKPLKYCLIDGDPVLYSVGADRDDDGGRLPDATRMPSGMKDPNRWAREWIPPDRVRHSKAANVGHSTAQLPVQVVPDGDWILWPPVEP